MDSANVQVLRQLEELFNGRRVDAFADLRIQTGVVSEAGDRVLTMIRFTGRGTGSETPLDERVSFLFSLRAGRVTKVDDLGRGQASTK
jgi:ketosteroid isomerase-like protein